MLHSKKLFSIFALSCSLISLTSCGTSDYDKNFPSNQNDTLVTVNGEEIDINDIFYNSMKDYYENLSDANAKTLNKLLDNVVKTKISDGDAYTKLSDEEIKNKAEEAMLDKVRDGSFDKDYYFDEEKFAMSLKKDLYNINIGSGSTCDFSKETIITPQSTFKDVFTCDYSDYIEKAIKPNIIRNQLVTEYLYLDTYSSIGATNARDINIVRLTDGTNENVGSALKFINAYLDDLAKYEKEKDKYAYTQDLQVVAEAYKGNDTYKGVSDFYANHADLKNYSLLSNIDKELKKVATYDEETHQYIPLPDNKIDKDLFNKYTGNSAYSVTIGVKKAKNSLKKEKLYQSDMFLASVGIEGLPDAIKNRVFSSNYNTTNDSTRKDVTTYIGGKRLLTVPNAQNEVGNRQVIFYDSATTSYYLIEINEVITTGVLAKNDKDSEEIKAHKKKLVKKVSYEMVDLSTYRNDSTVYFLKDSDVKYNNKSFFDYMKTTYPALFEEETYEDNK